MAGIGVEMGNVWDRTVAFIGDHARSVLPIALLAILLPTVASNVVWDAAQQCDGSVSPLAGSIVSLVLVLPTLWAQLALTALVLTPDDAGTARRAATGVIGRTIAAMLLVFAVFVIAALPLALGMQGGGVARGVCDAASAGTGGQASWFVRLYGIVLALVAGFVLVRLTMLLPAVVAEGGVLRAIRRAFALSRGLVWRLIGVWLVFVLVYGIASLAASTAFGAVFRLVAPDAGPFGVTTIIVAVIVAAVRTAFTVIVATFAALLYRDVTGATIPADTVRPAA